MRVSGRLLVVAAMGMSFGIGLAATATAGTLAGGGPPPADPYRVATAHPVSTPFLVSTVSQRAAVAFWTPGRMEQAAAAGTRATAAGPVPATPTAAPGRPGWPGWPSTNFPPKGTPTAVKFAGIPTVGALFYTTGSQKHFCTASVADSQSGDLVLAAAHCVYSTRYATNVAYIPQYHDGLAPYGIWPVKAMLVASPWKTAHDPNDDFAFLALATLDGQQVQAVTNGLALGLNGSYAEGVTVIGYNDSDDQPVRCVTRSFEFRAGQQEFYCHDFWTGTSGGPWITDLNTATGTGTVHGVIGGYQAGGRYEWASYSAYFGSQMAVLYAAAEKLG